MAVFVYLVGEGRNDVGDLVDVDQYRTGREGYLQPAIRAIAASQCGELRFDGSQAKLLGRHSEIRSDLDAHGRRAQQAMKLAQAVGASVVVVHADTDKEAGVEASAVERRRRRGKIANALEGGFAAASTSQSPVHGVAAVPCRMSEAWALGDPDALVANGAVLPGPPDPEAIWGSAHDPTSDHPKFVLQRVLGRKPTSDDFAAIASSSDPHVVAAHCPESFLPFLKALAAP